MLNLSIGIGLGRALDSRDNTYYSTLAEPINRLSSGAGAFDFNGRSWAVDGSPVNADGLDHCLRLSGRRERIRFEHRQTDPNDRTELDSQLTLPHSTTLWGAMTVIAESFVKPDSIAAGSGVVFYQTHAGAGGGSPSFALRRKQNGNLHITRSTPAGDQNVSLYDQPLSFDEPHDFVWRQVINATNGSIEVWLDGVKIVDVSGVPVGATDNTGYAKFGAYAAGGIGTDPDAKVAFQFANVECTRSGIDLASRISAAPTWPQDLRAETNAPTVVARQASNSGGVNLNSWVPTMVAHSAGDGLIAIVTIDSNDPASPATNTGWTRLIQTVGATTAEDQQEVWYYGSGGVLTPAPNDAVAAPTINMSSEQSTAIVLAVRKPVGVAGDMVISATGFVTATSSSSANPPQHDQGASRPTLWLATNGASGTAAAISSYPPGYVNGAESLAFAGSGSAGVTTHVAEYRNTARIENPSAFRMGNARVYAAHTIAVGVQV